MKSLNKLKRHHDSSENYGGEFSILANQSYFQEAEVTKNDRTVYYTTFLYILSFISIACWIIALNVLPMGDIFQFLLGAVVLTINLMVFKWNKL